MLLPGQPHRSAEDRQVHVLDQPPLLHLRSGSAARTPDLGDHLLEHQFYLAVVAFVLDDPNVFEPHKGLKDLARMGEDKGAFGLFGHTSSLRHLCLFLDDPEL